jgi:hypothetical protein
VQVEDVQEVIESAHQSQRSFADRFSDRLYLFASYSISTCRQYRSVTIPAGVKHMWRRVENGIYCRDQPVFL